MYLNNTKENNMDEISKQLFKACTDGDLEKVKGLIEQGADVNAKDKYGYTPLHFAVGNGYPKIVEVLLKNDAKVNAKNKNGITPLHLAACNGRTEIVELLKQHKGE